jgi:hypothetical protein
MRENCKDPFGRKRRFGVMDTFVAQLATQARKPSASTLRVKDEDEVSSTKLKDFVVFTPTTDKREALSLFSRRAAHEPRQIRTQENYLIV